MGTVKDVLERLDRLNSELADILKEYNGVTENYTIPGALREVINYFERLKMEAIKELPEVYGLSFKTWYEHLRDINYNLDAAEKQIPGTTYPVDERKARLQLVETYLKLAKARKDDLEKLVKEKNPQ